MGFLFNMHVFLSKLRLPLTYDWFGTQLSLSSYIEKPHPLRVREESQDFFTQTCVQHRGLKSFPLLILLATPLQSPKGAEI
jgi:hypothetical protein